MWAALAQEKSHRKQLGFATTRRFLAQGVYSWLHARGGYLSSLPRLPNATTETPNIRSSSVHNGKCRGMLLAERGMLLAKGHGESPRLEGLMSKFAIGQKVVCVRDDWKNAFFGLSVRETGERYPVKDGVYTVIGHDWLLLADRPGLIIAEVNSDCIWAEQNFRPIEPRKTDISVFKKLLVNPKEKIDA